MSTELPTLSDIVNLLPQKLQLRFNSLSSYVLALVNELSQAGQTDTENSRKKLSEEDVQIIQLAAFVFTLREFMFAGSRSARIASRIFEEFGASGFQVGRTTFTQNHPNTLRGETLAIDLLASITSPRLRVLIENSVSVRELIQTLVSEMADNG